MGKDPREQFEAGAAAWADYVQRPLGCIRREVIWHNLVPHLPAIIHRGRPPRILDIGCGAGELGLRLACHGYAVSLVDYAPSMLDLARQAARALPQEVQSRLTLYEMAADDAERAFSQASFQGIICHTLIEYLPDPRRTVRSLSSLLGDAGLLSLSFVNRHAGVLRRIWSQGDPRAAMEAMEADGAFCATLFDLPGRAYSSEQVLSWLEDSLLETAAVRGVRVFADYLPGERLSDLDFFDALLRLEIAASSRAPYCELARYLQVIARNSH